jgi:hypothetical protein
MMLIDPFWTTLMTIFILPLQRLPNYPLLVMSPILVLRKKMLGKMNLYLSTSFQLMPEQGQGLKQGQGWEQGRCPSRDRNWKKEEGWEPGYVGGRAMGQGPGKRGKGAKKNQVGRFLFGHPA